MVNNRRLHSQLDYVPPEEYKAAYYASSPSGPTGDASTRKPHIKPATPPCNDATMVDYSRFSRSHLDGILRLCAAQGWLSFPADPERAARVLTAPGVTTVVALDEGVVVGFAELFSDGEIQAYLPTMAVAETRRGRGIGTTLVHEALRLAGGERIDLLSEDHARDFYRAFPHLEKPGIRLYPFHQRGTKTR